jgi:hypothetical protein
MPTPENITPNPTPTPTPDATPPVPGPLNWKRFIPTNWQSIIGTLAFTLVSILLGMFGIKSPVTPPPIPAPIFPDGWVILDDPETGEKRAFPSGWTEPRVQDISDALNTPNVYRWEDTEAAKDPEILGNDGNYFLWKAGQKANGGAFIPTINQGSVGSCVGCGFANAYMHCLACQSVTKRGPPQEFGIVVPEIIYAGSRVEANGGFAPLIGDGSTGAWAAKWLGMGGTLKRGVYGSHDLTTYSASRCRAWGRTGVPDEIEALARPNSASCALISSAEDARKALSQGYPIAVCSNQGFSNRRDADGFARAEGRWTHCMCIIGYRSDKRGFYVMNSWGENWISGPMGIGEPPPGGFWAQWDAVESMLRQRDSYAVSDVKGFPKRKINVDDWLTVAPVRPDLFDCNRQFPVIASRTGWLGGS